MSRIEKEGLYSFMFTGRLWGTAYGLLGILDFRMSGLSVGLEEVAGWASEFGQADTIAEFLCIILKGVMSHRPVYIYAYIYIYIYLSLSLSLSV